MAGEIFIPETDLHICKEEGCGMQLVVRRYWIGSIAGIATEGFVIPRHDKPLNGPKCPESGKPVNKLIRTVLDSN